MRAIEIDVTIDSHGRVQTQLPNDIAPQQARAIILLDEPPAPAAESGGESLISFSAISLQTEGYRFRRDDTKNDD